MTVEAENESKPQPEDTPWTKWWAGLEHSKGDRASLRRCRSVLEVALEPAFHNLLKRIGSRLNEVDRDRVAAAVGVVAHVKRNVPGHSLAQLMARPREKPVVSDARFRRLLRLETPDELLHELVRVLHMLGGDAPINSMATDIANWGDAVRKQWALHYYENADLS